MFKFKRFIIDQNGNSLVLVSISMVTLLAFVGLVVDFSKIYVIKTDLQKAANAAVLSGAQELLTNESNVEGIVDTILMKHDEQDNLESLDINIEQDVTVSLNEEVPLSFAKIFGVTSIDVPVDAKAEIKPIGSITGIVPLGIDEQELEFEKEYILKVGAGSDLAGSDDSNFGNGFFGALDLGGRGASNYEENLREGYDGVVEIGDILETKTGNMAQPTLRPIEERINNCDFTLTRFSEIPRDCSRIVLVPVYRPYNQTGNQLKEVEVVGFAYFYLAYVGTVDESDDSDNSGNNGNGNGNGNGNNGNGNGNNGNGNGKAYVTGQFIAYAGTGSTNDGDDVVSFGAYGIRLTD
ncbi:Tad domain-containing protein [Chengkuizengella axinellae]|uniref:Tad domain-containing protein n=1 Tax=Chengkuizengella axinellae TaxID=3064388 RepID=A0ABT9IYR6_9BACL|nr:Tad domain-containing protein [Chengkuizengella sp. 2205SS18-9]MDP5274492.1 Tad domain-containing protein [Chengkuizengella sp. 2205SS18-9]